MRVGKKPPIPHTTSFSRVVPIQKMVQERIGPFSTKFTMKTVNKKFVFNQTTWTGGRVLGPISSNSLAYLGLSVSRNKVKQVPPRTIQAVLKLLEASHVE